MKYSFLAVLCCNALLAIGQDYYQRPKYTHEIGVGLTPLIVSAIPARMYVVPVQITYKYLKPRYSCVGAISYQYSELTKGQGRNLELVGTSGNRADFRLWEEEYHHTQLMAGIHKYRDTIGKFVFYLRFAVNVGWKEYRNVYYNVFFTNQTPGWVHQNTALTIRPGVGPDGISRSNYYTIGPQFGWGFTWKPFKRLSFDYMASVTMMYIGLINHEVHLDPQQAIAFRKRSNFLVDGSFLQVGINYRFAEGN